MEFDTIISKRQSVRSFKKKKASWKDVLEAIDSANQSPFAGNQNHLHYLIIETKDTINSLSKIAEQTWINEAGIVVLVLSDDTHLENLYGDRGRIYSRQQAGAAIQTLLLKLVDLGLSACWVGAYTDETIKQNLGIPQHIQIEAIIPIGYSQPIPKKRRYKKDLEKVIYWEAWEVPNRPTIFQEPNDNKSLKY